MPNSLIEEKTIFKKGIMPGKQILLLEKEKGLARILTLLLKQASFRVTSCSSAATALAEIVAGNSTGNGVDLLIIDIPESDCEGSLLLSQLRFLEIAPPLIVITPYGSEVIAAELSRKNSPLFLWSPFEPEELLGCIEQIRRNPKFH